jgi:hypothetical protein
LSLDLKLSKKFNEKKKLREQMMSSANHKVMMKRERDHIKELEIA